MSAVIARPTITSRVWGAYGVLGLVSASHAVTHIVSALMPLIYPMVMQEFGFGYSQLGLMLAVSNVLSGIFQIVFGYLGRYALRRTILGAQNFFIAAHLILFSLTSTFPQFFGTALAGRIAMTPQHPVGNSLVADMFGKRLRGSAFSINFAGGNLGTVFVPMIATFLIMSIGWRWTLALFSLPGMIVGALLFLLISETRTMPTTEGGAAPSRNPIREALRLMRNRNVLMVFLVSSIAAGGRGIGIVTVYVPLYLKDGLKLDAGLVGTIFTILMIGSVIGPLLGGRLSDKYGRKRVVFTAYCLATLAMIGVILVGGNIWILVPIILVVGLATYAESPVLQTLLADCLQRGTRDFAFGLYFAVNLATGSIWTWTLGFLIDNSGFLPAFYLMATSYVLAGLLLVLMIREPKHED
ncbi:MAG: MFS transporter [Chloroflexi bacterium]|nr:MFS transporter [Chloroflexota bacterium]